MTKAAATILIALNLLLTFANWRLAQRLWHSSSLFYISDENAQIHAFERAHAFEYHFFECVTWHDVDHDKKMRDALKRVPLGQQVLNVTGSYDDGERDTVSCWVCRLGGEGCPYSSGDVTSPVP